ncbi:alkene reductase [Aureibacter tunicatorum]|nr:alkene reductase [Aureibacter tunicatorum]
MAPMTRSRTTEGDIPTPLMAEYYSQRAGAGLIITEGAPISNSARGYSMTPGIYTEEQIEGWKLSTKAVHQKNGKIFVQLWHVGRRSHSSITGEKPWAPSAIKVSDKVFGPLQEGGYGMIETEMPRAMNQNDIDTVIHDFTVAAKNAMEAGFDGVEIHGAHGYLIDQFLRTTSNQRTDAYGGSQENRMRLLLEVVKSISKSIGADKVAIRLSPFVSEGMGNEHDPEMPELTLKVLQQLQPLGLAYIHFSENISDYKKVPEEFRKDIRNVYSNPIMVCGKYVKNTAETIIEKRYADVVAFGQDFITNPDLVYRLENNLPLTQLRSDSHSTFYGGGAEGFTDYPTYQKMLEKELQY